MRSLLLVDDHPVVLFGLRLMLQTHARFTIVAEAANAVEACAKMTLHRPDYAVIDLVMGSREGTALIEDMLGIRPDIRILVYTSLDASIHAQPVLSAGARGYLNKTAGLERVADALDQLEAGKIYTDVGARPNSRIRRSDEAVFSQREREVLQLMGGGAGLQHIAQKLDLSVKTVGTYRERLKVKLGLDNVRMLERYAEAYALGTE